MGKINTKLQTPAPSAAAPPPTNTTLRRPPSQSVNTSLPNHMNHPSHASCTLSLLAAPAYASGIYTCNACRRQGTGRNFHCHGCSYDLHDFCATKHMCIRHQAHGCALLLTFADPYAGGFNCDVCHQNGANQWLYRCHSCQFDAHLDCVSPSAPGLQHVHSLPPSTVEPHYHNQLVHSASTGGIGMNPNPGHLYGHGSGPRPVQCNLPAAGGWPGAGLASVVGRGVVGGVAQGLGQSAVQGIFGDGGGAGAGAGAGGSGNGGAAAADNGSGFEF